MISKRQYVEYLLSTPGSFTCTHMCEPTEHILQISASACLTQCTNEPPLHALGR